MPGTKEASSMYKTVSEHDELINENILPRLDKVEKSQAANDSELEDVKAELQGIKSEVTAVRSAQSSLELTVLKDGAQTRDLLNRFVDHYFTSDGKAFVSRDAITKQKWGTKEKVWLGIIGVFSGGGLVTIGNVAIAWINNR